MHFCATEFLIKYAKSTRRHRKCVSWILRQVVANCRRSTMLDAVFRRSYIHTWLTNIARGCHDRRVSTHRTWKTPVFGNNNARSIATPGSLSKLNHQQHSPRESRAFHRSRGICTINRRENFAVRPPIMSRRSTIIYYIHEITDRADQTSARSLINRHFSSATVQWKPIIARA